VQGAAVTVSWLTLSQLAISVFILVAVSATTSSNRHYCLLECHFCYFQKTVLWQVAMASISQLAVFALLIVVSMAAVSVATDSTTAAGTATTAHVTEITQAHTTAKNGASFGNLCNVVLLLSSAAAAALLRTAFWIHPNIIASLLRRSPQLSDSISRLLH
jgi:hypothetical protein